MRKLVFSIAGSLLVPSLVHSTDFSEAFTSRTNWPENVQLHDFNRDGNLDLLAVDFENTGFAGSGNPATMHQHLGNGDGTFHKLDTIRYTLSNRDHKLADLNADGYVDLFHNHFYRGTADGTFASAITTSSISTCVTSLVLNINGDNLNDLICSERVSGQQDVQFFTYINQGDFAFERGPMLPTTSTVDKKGINGIVQGDLNGDGQIDVVRILSLIHI